MQQTPDYYKLTANQIYEDLNVHIQDTIEGETENVNFVVFPHVYPSHKFRTTAFVLKNLKELVAGKKICDMGCGPGIVGLYSLLNGAERVVQADINPNAVANAVKNNSMHAFGEEKIKTYQSDCFDNIPIELFDLIIFNMPFHSDAIRIDDPLKYAFYDPEFTSIKKFLAQAKSYMHKKTEILIAFSNKGKTDVLESLFKEAGYSWELWKLTNTDQEYDNRIYRLYIA